MKKLDFPEPFQHNHPPVRELSDIDTGPASRGERVADWVYNNVGSWRFILIQSALVAAWIILNVAGYIRPWDPYPFIFMNLIFSLQSAYTASLILMSQNRQDRLKAHNDYLTSYQAEVESRAVLDNLAAQDKALQEIYQEILAIRSGLDRKSFDPSR